MSVTVTSEDLLSLLSASRITAAQKPDAGALHAVLLSSARVEGEDAGTEEVLVATSTDGLRASQVRVPADGQLSSPILLSIPSIGWLTSMVSTVSKTAQATDKEAECSVQLSVTGGDSRRLSLVSLVDGEPGARADDPTALLPADEFTINDALLLLNPSAPSKVRDANGDDLAKGNLQVFDPAALGLLLKVAKQFGSVSIYTLGHPAAELVITAGSSYRATITPVVYGSDVDVSSPDVEIVPVSLEESDEDDEEGSDDFDGEDELSDTDEHVEH